jgi:hypothetical protein
MFWGVIEMTTVKRPAIKKPSGVVVPGKVGGSHKQIGVKGVRGFQLSDGSFVGRTDAAKVAKKAGQIGKIPSPRLHSSNLHSSNLK